MTDDRAPCPGSQIPDGGHQAGRTGGQLIVEALVANGVRRISCVPGESFLAVLDALHDTDIDVLVCRQEGGAAMMADGWGKLTGEPGICMVTRGPGATNASAGLHIARQDSIADDPLRRPGPARDAREREAFQEVEYRRAFTEVAKWVAEIDDAAPHSRIRHPRLRDAPPRGGRARWCSRCPRTC